MHPGLHKARLMPREEFEENRRLGLAVPLPDSRVWEARRGVAH